MNNQYVKLVESLTVSETDDTNQSEEQKIISNNVFVKEVTKIMSRKKFGIVEYIVKSKIPYSEEEYKKVLIDIFKEYDEDGGNTFLNQEPFQYNNLLLYSMGRAKINPKPKQLSDDFFMSLASLVLDAFGPEELRAKYDEIVNRNATNAKKAAEDKAKWDAMSDAEKQKHHDDAMRRGIERDYARGWGLGT